MAVDKEVAQLRKELVGLFTHIQRIRKELAAIRRPGSEDEDHFSNMSDQLDAIVETTEEATNTIMEQMEGIDALVDEARKEKNSPRTKEILDGITDRANVVFEACAFQDLTGQRVTKVVRTLKFIEERVNSLMKAWGADALARVKVDVEQESDPERKMLHGPQRKGTGLRQNDVDSLLGNGDPKKEQDDAELENKEEFNQDDIDKLFG